MGEIWKPVKEYEGLYEVSNMGRVRSLNYRQTGKVKVLCPMLNSVGYLTVKLCKNGEIKTKTIHRLVPEAFLPNPDNLPCINHKDENKQNNRVENLEWCTVKYNNEYSGCTRKSSESRRKPVLQYTKTGILVAEYESIEQSSRQTGIKSQNISACCLCRPHYKSAGGYIWKFKEDCE